MTRHSLGPPGRDELGWTLDRHILERQRRIPGASGDFTGLFQSIALAGRVIASKVAKAGLADVLGATGAVNVQGETVQKLDELANNVLVRCVEAGGHVCVMASEEDESIIPVPPEYPAGKYVLMFDPLDGSSNIDTGAAVGTIFSVLRYDRRGDDPMASLLQRGAEQVAAGYILYGSSTVFVLTTGNGVSMFVLDPSIGAFLRVADGLRIPRSGKYYSCNEGNRLTFPEGYQRYLDWAQSQSYSTRYSGTMVADVHRILLKGGVFLYPPTKKAPEGKLRLLYEGNPMAMIVEQAGGKAYAGPVRLMERVPTGIHQRTSVVMGSPDEVDHVLRHLA